MHSRRRIVGLITSILIFALLLFAWVERNALYDWYRLRDYNAPAVVASLAKSTTMTEYAQHMFYVNHPEVEDRNEFNSNCPNNGGEQTIILGCYHTHQSGIFIFDIDDPKLDGVEQVTAAHETLHAIYERLGGDEKAEVDQMLRDFYANGLKDQRIIDTINSYKKFEPDNINDEMHSIFGTEVANLPKPLEDYYQKYFENRAKVVAFSNKYQATFTSRKAQAAALLAKIESTEQQLNTTKNQIDNLEAQLRIEAATLEATRHTTNDASGFNAKVAAYNQKVDQYRKTVSTYNDLIEQHNAMVEKYNAITLETSQLLQELNSRSPTLSTQ